jgi:hypothetical protein
MLALATECLCVSDSGITEDNLRNLSRFNKGNFKNDLG